MDTNGTEDSQARIATPLESRAEVRRLLRVYQDYARRGFGQSKWSPVNRGNLAIQRERDLQTRAVLAGAGFLPLSGKRILEVGCGAGEHLAALQYLGAAPSALVGIDLIPDRLRAARARFPNIAFPRANAEALPFADGAFDLVAVLTVFTSILSRTMRANSCREIQRVLRPGGGVLWYDFRLDNPCNRQVRGINRREIRRLFPGFTLSLRTVSLLPPLARHLGRLTELLYPWLRRLPFLRSHYLGILIKP
ncbi:MAG: methyltransferase domain-containing protein [Verrucomicrobia bacterium]|nr:methyltransferase domain-containing protein [Verrucomicrobiota bacterium]